MEFCNYTTIIGVLGWLGITIYNIGFCIILSYTVRNTLKGSMLSKFRYHAISLVLIALGAIGIFFSNYDSSKNLNSICVVKYSTVAPYIRTFASVCLILLALISIYRFKTGIPKNSFFQKQSLYKYYYMYIFFVVTLQILSEILGLIGNINCRSQQPDPALGISNSISNILELIGPILLALLRFSHPAVSSKIKSCFKKMKSCKEENEADISALFEVTEREYDLNREQYNWLGCLLESIRGSQVYSFLVGILVSHIDFKSDVIKSIRDVDYTCRYVF